MNRISITFNDESYAKLQTQAEKKKISLAKYVRELVDIGLQVEEAASQNEDHKKLKKNEIDDLGELKELWKNNLIWTLESRYLSRYLVENIVGKEEEAIAKILEKAREKSRSFVAGLLHEIPEE
ncbi:hypothetical protein BH10PSE19_BH10PSE19_16320 [soil metagenome]